MTSWDVETDLVVVGSGAGGMTAALTAKLQGLDSLVLEKTELYGGSTAISGGGIWVPNNHLMTEAGIKDSMDNARTYMKNTVGNRTSEERQEAFLRYAPEMIQYLSTLPSIEFEIMPGFSDYYPERPGGLKEGGRGIESVVFSGKKLGDLYEQLRPHPVKVPFDFALMISDIRKVALAGVYLPYLLDVFRILVRNLRGKLTREKHLAAGAALVARLRMSLHEQNVPVWLNARLVKIIFENESVVGVEVEKEGKTIQIRAAKGVVLAAGGFPHNEAMRKKYQKHPVDTGWTAAAPGNTGEVIEMGMAAGAAVDLMDGTWGMPTTLPPGEHPLPMVMERSYPYSMMVNAKGRRFTNEAASYVDVVHAMYEEDAEGSASIPAFLIMDKRFWKRYLIGTELPVMRSGKYEKNGYLVKGDTLEELAGKVGIDPPGLMETVKEFNEFVHTGKDPEFGKGDSAYDRFYSDPSVKPNCCLGTIEKPPFYSIVIFPGDIGTKGGLLTNGSAQVLTEDGEMMKGLYAVGNTSASVMGDTYPGSGSTIGPAMTFGYVAAMHAAGHLH